LGGRGGGDFLIELFDLALEFGNPGVGVLEFADLRFCVGQVADRLPPRGVEGVLGLLAFLSSVPQMAVQFAPLRPA
jgi:hypothetical protein